MTRSSGRAMGVRRKAASICSFRRRLRSSGLRHSSNVRLTSTAERKLRLRRWRYEGIVNEGSFQEQNRSQIGCVVA
jgi:hypothetical protein